MKTSEYTVQELMAVLISREIKNREKVGVGTLSPLPAAGAWLAREHHAPDLELSVLGDREAASMSRTDFFDAIQRGGCDLFFLSGAQVDRKANINLQAIGHYSRPRVRLPGGAGSGMIYYMARRTILFLNRHTTKTLVEAVDFITSPGSSVPGVYRRGYPSLLLTPLCAMRFNRQKEELILESIHPGVEIEEVKNSTGWSLDFEQAPFTALPTLEELLLLRGQVRQKLLQLYPEFALNYIKQGNRPTR